MTSGSSKSSDPQYWGLLTDDDKAVYRRITAALSAPTNRNKRNRRIEDFQAILDALEVFENSDAEGKWKRCLVCGVCKLSSAIAVNTTQLKRLVFKCKSSINGALKGLGYDLIMAHPDAGEELLQQVPYLRDNPAELRRWTIRTCSAQASPAPSADATPVAAAAAADGAQGLELREGRFEGLDRYFASGEDANDFMFDDFNL